MRKYGSRKDEKPGRDTCKKIIVNYGKHQSLFKKISSCNEHLIHNCKIVAWNATFKLIFVKEFDIFK